MIMKVMKVKVSRYVKLNANKSNVKNIKSVYDMCCLKIILFNINIRHHILKYMLELF